MLDVPLFKAPLHRGRSNSISRYYDTSAGSTRLLDAFHILRQSLLFKSLRLFMIVVPPQNVGEKREN